MDNMNPSGFVFSRLVIWIPRKGTSLLVKTLGISARKLFITPTSK
jgi:hypothetical protein